jgi:hypothetical protein
MFSWSYRGIKRALAVALPPNSTVAQVEGWLDSQGIRHYRHVNPEGTTHNTIYAEILDARVWWLESGEIQIYFHFNAEWRLIRYEVEWFTVDL